MKNKNDIYYINSNDKYEYNNQEYNNRFDIQFKTNLVVYKNIYKDNRIYIGLVDINNKFNFFGFKIRKYYKYF